MDECYALLVEQADVVYLGVALPGKRDDAYRDGYWREVVQAVDARRVLPIHWDDFLLPLSRGLQPMQSLLDDFDGTMQYLEARSRAEARDLRPPVLWATVNPFQGLR